MYPGWIAIGQTDPWSPPLGGTEIVNNSRALAYAANAGMCWLQDCNDCPDALTPGGPDFQSPAIDPAPWYSADDPDTWGFLGVLGMSLVGDESSTRTVAVANAVTFGGVIGPPYFGPRVMVLRGIAIAEDECSLQAGLNWLQARCAEMGDACVGDTMTFFDCCPCLCPEYDAGDPDDADCFTDCVQAYLRHYNNVAVTAGPNVIRHPSLYSRGAMVEFELIITAADPTKFSEGVAMAAMVTTGSTPLDEAPVAAKFAEEADPFSIPGVTTASMVATLTRPSLPVAVLPTQWVRDEVDMDAGDFYITELTRSRPLFQLDCDFAPAEGVRLGLWDGDELLTGYFIPFIPANTSMVIDTERRLVTAIYNGTSRTLTGFVKSYDGGLLRWPSIPHGEHRITVDQQDGAHAPLTLTCVVSGAV